MLKGDLPPLARHALGLQLIARHDPTGWLELAQAGHERGRNRTLLRFFNNARDEGVPLSQIGQRAARVGLHGYAGWMHEQCA